MSNMSGRSWPSKRLPDQVGAPSNAAVGSVPDLPKPRNSAAATSAMDVLADAVWRIDARDHQNAGAPAKVVRNLGTAGSVLDCRTGSTSVPDSNDPLFLPAEQRAYVYLPGVASNYMSVPNEAALQITGDLDLIVNAALDSFTVTNGTLISKLLATGNQRSYWFRTNAVGQLEFVWSTDGGTTGQILVTSTASISGSPTWFRATMDVDNGTGKYEVRFYTSSNGTTWTQLGNAVVGTTTTSIFAGTSVVEVGTASAGSNSIAGKFYRAIVKNGIDGTTVLDVDTSVLTSGSATSFTAATGQTVTINRSTSGRKTVVVPSADVKKVDDANVYLPGVNGNYLSVPDSAALDVTGDIDIQIEFALDTWTGTNPHVLTKRASASSDYAYWIGMGSSKVVQFGFTSDGTTQVLSSSSTGLPYGNGGRGWVRITRSSSTGTVTFYTSYDGSTWTQLGNTVSTTPSSIYASNTLLGIGATATGTAGPSGKYYRVIIKNGIDGTTVLDVDCSVAPTNFTPGYASAFPAVTGQTVTMNSTAGSAMRVNGERFASGSPVFLFGTDDYMEVPMSATGSKALDFGPNDSFTVLAVVRQWATPVNNQRIVSKSSLNSVGGVTIRQNGTNYSYSNTILDGSTTVNPISPTGSSGSLAVVAVTANRFGQLGTSWLNAAAGTSLSIAGVGPVASSRALRIGVESGASTGYADMEFMGAGVWRRVLSPAEQQAVLALYQSKVA